MVLNGELWGVRGSEGRVGVSLRVSEGEGVGLVG